MRSIIPKQKKGQMSGGGIILTFFIIMFVVLFIGFIMVVGSAIINFVMDEFVPEISSLGVIGDTNFTEITDMTIAPLNEVIQSFTWLTGVMYIFMIIALVAVPFMFRNGAETWMLGFFFGLLLLLIITSIFISNMYEEFYDDDGDLADRLKEHQLLSWFVLNSPMIFTIISFISGIVLFSGLAREEFV